MIDEYLLKLKGYADGLRAAGNSVSKEQLILYVLAGVGTKHESVVVNLTYRDCLILQEVQFLLQNHEMRLEFSSSASILDLSNPMVNLAHNRKPPSAVQ